MDLTPSIKNALQTLTSTVANDPALSAKAGTQIHAIVSQVQKLSAEEQQTLLNLIAKAATNNLGNLLKQPTKTAASTTTTSSTSLLPTNSTGNTTAEPGAPKDLQTLITTKQSLYAIQLLVGRKQILTISPTPLPTQHKVKLQVTESGQLQLLDTNRPAVQQPKTTGHPLLNTTQGKAAANSVTQQSNPNAPPPSTLKINSAGMNELQGALKSYMPKQQPLSHLVSTLIKTAPQLTNLGKSNIIPPKVAVQVEKILASLVNAKQEMATENVKQALNTSGSFLERGLSTHIAQRTSRALLPSNQPSPEALNRPITRASTEQQNKNLDQDLKAQLLRLTQVTEEALQTSQHNIGSRPTLTTSNDAIDKVLNNLLLLFGKPNTKSSVEGKKDLVLRALTQLSQAGIAKITTQQIQKIISSFSEGQAPIGGQIELPLRFGEAIIPLSLAIYETPTKDEKVEEDKKDKKNSNKRRRQWNLFMEFDLDDIGWFSCEVTTLDEKVKTKMWAEKDDTKTAARKRLDELKQKLVDSGIQVEDIQVLDGIPPKKPNYEITHNLVDITT
ncbi:flagellar hook-length control protein FliK [Teredinibacter sp. KSP-S5-2]|uniref:flagellar hook-length control protein FliK n=1 Tax=Teredinibacter sp. KSP-S5-2 TaxID=3034506 RepID=UPI002934114B|nr:flagellar hook-length control protein FliK [Teredinibacter sp. KSP-S5-2]WNO07709.1 flagellar hook-length control protein FliK [Teredinibacter sp. KSP-S5-2]